MSLLSGVGTVARQEFRLRIRAGRWRLLLLVFFLVLLGFTLLLRGALGALEPGTVRFPGTVVYGGLMLFVLGLALLVVPALAAQSVNGDRERGTLAVLQVTRLSAAEITLGKFVAAWGTALVFLALTFPLVGYAMTQGGVPFGRVVVVTLVLALLLGTVCAISLWLSAVLSRTTTSGVLAYLAVFGLTVGTLIVFGLVTAVTSEQYTQTYSVGCQVAPALPPSVPQAVPVPPGGTPVPVPVPPAPAPLPPGSPPVPAPGLAPPCPPGTEQIESFPSTRVRTDRTWFLLAPNPFVILADAAPRLPDREPVPGGRDIGPSAADLDPLGQIGRTVRELRRPPLPIDSFSAFAPTPLEPPPPPKSVWPAGLAVDVALGVGALYLTSRRLRTPTRTLPKGQRVA